VDDPESQEIELVVVAYQVVAKESDDGIEHFSVGFFIFGGRRRFGGLDWGLGAGGCGWKLRRGFVFELRKLLPEILQSVIEHRYSVLQRS